MVVSRSIGTGYGARPRRPGITDQQVQEHIHLALRGIFARARGCVWQRHRAVDRNRLYFVNRVVPRPRYQKLPASSIRYLRQPDIIKATLRQVHIAGSGRSHFWRGERQILIVQNAIRDRTGPGQRGVLDFRPAFLSSPACRALFSWPAMLAVVTLPSARAILRAIQDRRVLDALPRPVTSIDRLPCPAI